MIILILPHQNQVVVSPQLNRPPDMTHLWKPSLRFTQPTLLLRCVNSIKIDRCDLGCKRGERGVGGRTTTLWGLDPPDKKDAARSLVAAHLKAPIPLSPHRCRSPFRARLKSRLSGGSSHRISSHFNVLIKTRYCTLLDHI